MLNYSKFKMFTCEFCFKQTVQTLSDSWLFNKSQEGDDRRGQYLSPMGDPLPPPPTTHPGAAEEEALVSIHTVWPRGWGRRSLHTQKLMLVSLCVGRWIGCWLLTFYRHKKGEGRLGLTFFDISSASSNEKKTSELANKIYILTVHCILSCVFSNFIFGYKFVTDTVTQRQVDGDKYKV